MIAHNAAVDARNMSCSSDVSFLYIVSRKNRCVHLVCSHPALFQFQQEQERDALCLCVRVYTSASLSVLPRSVVLP